MVTATHAQVQDCYISYYQRPGDPYGLVYWEEYLLGSTLEQVQAAFGNSSESQKIYGPINADTIGGVVDKIYLGLFGRLPDAAGKAFYVDGFNNGMFSPTGIAYSIMIGAQGADAVVVQQKRNKANFISRQQVSQNCGWFLITPEESGTLDVMGVDTHTYNQFYTTGGSGGLGINERPDLAASPSGYVYVGPGDRWESDVAQAADVRVQQIADSQNPPRTVPPPAVVNW